MAKKFDFRLVFEAAKGGDESAREQLGEQALTMALQAARGRMGQVDRQLLDSVDIRQSVVLRFFNKLPDLSFEGEPQLAGWLGGVASNLVKEKRKHAHRLMRDQRLKVPLPTAGLPDHLAQSVSRVVNRIYLSEMLHRLPELDATVVRLHKLEGYTFAEIAEQLELPGADATRQRCARALVRLAGMLPPDVTVA